MSEKIIAELKAKMFALWEDSVRRLSCQCETLQDGAKVCRVYCLTNTEIWNVVRRPRHNRLPLNILVVLRLTVLQSIVIYCNCNAIVFLMALLQRVTYLELFRFQFLRLKPWSVRRTMNRSVLQEMVGNKLDFTWVQPGDILGPLGGDLGFIFGFMWFHMRFSD